MNKIHTKVLCPYCGFEDITLVKLKHFSERKIILCDVDEGGCDKYFVIKAEIKVKAESFQIEEPGQD